MTDSKPGNSSKEADKGISRSIAHRVEIHQATSRTSVFANTSLVSEFFTLSFIWFYVIDIIDFYKLSKATRRVYLFHNFEVSTMNISRVCHSVVILINFLNTNRYDYYLKLYRTSWWLKCYQSYFSHLKYMFNVLISLFSS